MIMYAVFQHLDHEGIATGTGYVVKSREAGGHYDDPYRDRAPVWTFGSEALALRIAERMTKDVGRC